MNPILTTPHRHVGSGTKKKWIFLSGSVLWAAFFSLNADAPLRVFDEPVILDDGRAQSSGRLLTESSDYISPYLRGGKNLINAIGDDGTKFSINQDHPAAKSKAEAQPKSESRPHQHTLNCRHNCTGSPPIKTFIPDNLLDEESTTANPSPVSAETPNAAPASAGAAPPSDTNSSATSTQSTSASLDPGSVPHHLSGSGSLLPEVDSVVHENPAKSTELRSIEQAQKTSPLNSNAGSHLVETIKATDRLKESLLATSLLERSRQILRETERKRKADQEKIETNAFRYLSQQAPEKLPALLGKLGGELVTQAAQLQKVKQVNGGIDKDDLRPQMAALDSAIAKVKAAENYVAENVRNVIKGMTSLENFFGFNKPKGTNSDSSVDPALSLNLANTLFEFGDSDSNGNRTPASNSASALVNKIIGLNILPPDEQKLIIKQLNLAEKKTLTLNTGETITVLLMHAGYLLGGGTSAVDCSSFVSMVMPNNISNARLTTLDLLAVWKFRTDGYFPKPPIYDPVRAEFVKRFAKAFIPINPYLEDTSLLPGDLLLYRIPGVAIGHVLIVESYDSKRYIAQVIEAAQSAGTIRKRDYYLSQHPTKRIIRPGLLVLRLKSEDNGSCRYPAGSKKQKPLKPSGGAQ